MVQGASNAGRLGLLPLLPLCVQAVDMVGAQPLLWVIPPSDMRNSCDAIAAALGVEAAEAQLLVTKMPLLLALEPQWLRLRWGELLVFFVGGRGGWAEHSSLPPPPI